MALIVYGDVNAKGELIMGSQYTVQVDKQVVFKMEINSVKNVSGAVVLKNTATGCSIVVEKTTGKVVTPGQNPFLKESDFEAAMQKYTDATNLMIDAYKQLSA